MRLGRGGKGLAAFALLVTIAGCATAPPPPPELGVPVPGRYDAVPEDFPPPAADDPDLWWTTFGEPRLTELIETALVGNPDRGAAAARVEQAAAQARIAGAALLPQVDAGGSANRGRQNFIGFPIPGSGEQVLSSTSTTLGVSLDVAWEADLWGRLRAARSSAAAQAEATAADLAGFELSLAGQVAKAWFALQEAEAQALLAAETVDNRESSVARIRRRFEAGLRPALDLRLALSEQASAEALLAQRRQQADAVARQLETLVGGYPDADLAATLGPGHLADLPPPPPPPPVGVPSELLARRPDLAAAELRLAAAGFSVAEARANLYPQLRLTGSAGRRSQELEDLLDSDFTVWSLAANLLQPIFAGGRLRAGVDLSEAMFEEAAYGYASAVLTAFREVETSLAAHAFLEDQLAALAEAVEQAVAAQSQAEQRYAAGLVDVLVVLDSQRRALDARSRYLAVQRQLLENRVDLHLALGGGFGPETRP